MEKGKNNRIETWIEKEYGTETWIEKDMFLSDAFLCLGLKGTSPVTSHASHKILMMLLGKQSAKNTPDKNELTLPYAELESYGINQKSATRGFDELLAKGFISIVDPGGAFENHKAVYSLEGTYQLWNLTHKQVFEKRKRNILRGYQITEKNKQELKKINTNKKVEKKTQTFIKKKTYPITNAVLEFFTGQSEALHLWLYVVNKPPEFILRRNHLKKNVLKTGETRYRKAIKFLKDSGLLIQKPIRGKNEFIGSEYIIKDLFKNIIPTEIENSNKLYTLKQLHGAWYKGFLDGTKAK